MASVTIRPIRVEGNVAHVSLTKGYEAIIDAADVPLVEGYNWSAIVKTRRNGTIRAVYAMRGSRSGGSSRSIYMHRIIAGTPSDLEVDHRDGDGLNNRRANLRNDTAQQNRCNQRVNTANTSGVKGVHYDAQTGKWRASIGAQGLTLRLGRFASLEEAASAYAVASADIHGEFGRTE